ncbi:hypothetical protein [Chryseobacterium sp.]|uniref:hypothetical protein n=1 Tax=Chryseobacterium sp. TaxID=1871047 RepID=UPI0033418310
MTNHPQKLVVGNFIILSHEQCKYRLIMQDDSNLVLYYKNRNGVERLPDGFRIKIILGGNNKERAIIMTVDVNKNPFN